MSIVVLTCYLQTPPRSLAGFIHEEMTMEKNKDGLYPCPFCGNSELAVSLCRGDVKCRCGARSPNLTPYMNKGMNERDIIRAAWNKRADL